MVALVVFAPLVFAQSATSSLDQVTISTEVDAALIVAEDGIDDSDTEIVESSEQNSSQPDSDQTSSNTDTVTETEEPEDSGTELAATDAELTAEQGSIDEEVATEPDDAAMDQTTEPEEADVVLAVEPDETDSVQLVEPDETDVVQTVKPDDTSVTTAIKPDETDVVQAVEPDDTSVATAIEPDETGVVLTAEPDDTDVELATEAENIEIQTRISIENVLLGWAYAWAKQDVEGYLDFYADEFTPNNAKLSRDDWVELRTVRLLRPKKIELNLADIELKINDEPVKQVVFKQSYKSDTFQDKIIKSMTFIQKQNQWKILSEQTVKVL